MGYNRAGKTLTSEMAANDFLTIDNWICHIRNKSEGTNPILWNKVIEQASIHKLTLWSWNLSCPSNYNIWKKMDIFSVSKYLSQLYKRWCSPVYYACQYTMMVLVGLCDHCRWVSTVHHWTGQLGTSSLAAGAMLPQLVHQTGIIKFQIVNVHGYNNQRWNWLAVIMKITQYQLLK